MKIELIDRSYFVILVEESDNEYVNEAITTLFRGETPLCFLKEGKKGFLRAEFFDRTNERS